MKSSFKRIVMLLLLVTTLLLTVACTKTSYISTYTDEEGNIQSVVVTDDDTFGGGGKKKTTVRIYTFNNPAANEKYLKAIKEDFNVKYPNIKIELQTSTGSFYTNLLSDFSAGTQADLFYMEPGEIYPFLQEGYLEPLDSYFNKSTLISQDDVWEINKLAYRYDATTDTFGGESGQTYALLKDWTTDAMLYYNRSLFTEEQLAIIERDEDNDGIFDPMSYEEFETLCQELLIKEGNTIKQYSFLPGLAEAKVLSQFLTNAGLSWFDKTTYRSTLSTPEVKEIIEYYYRILSLNNVNNVGSTHMPLFEQGKVAMIMGGLYNINENNLDKFGDNLGVAYPPVKDKTKDVKPFTTGCVALAMSSSSRVKDAAWKFIEWYMDYFGKVDAQACSNFTAKKDYAKYIIDPKFNDNVTRLRIGKIFYASLSKAIIIERNKYCSQASFESAELAYAGEYLNGDFTLNQFIEAVEGRINAVVELNRE